MLIAKTFLRDLQNQQKKILEVQIMGTVLKAN